jgi:biotin carboxylase
LRIVDWGQTHRWEESDRQAAEAGFDCTTTRNIFVLGLDDFNLPYLKTVRHAETYRFHRLLGVNEVVRAPGFDVPVLLRKATATLDKFDGSVDGIVGYWDFPTILMLPLLRRHVGLPGPTLESVLRCEHKYWSRQVQLEVAAEHVPPFALVDPFADPRQALPDIAFPFWIKPIKAHSSKLGFRVSNQQEFEHALQRIRAGIAHFADPMNAIMSHADLPDEIAKVHGGLCIAEAMISRGRQCTLEGYVFQGEPYIYGVVDSIRGPNRSSFARYEYPSTLPRAVRKRMASIACRVIACTGLDDSPFNMEFYWNRANDQLWILEINARLSKSHFPLFAKVEGVAHAEVMIDLALGRRPEYPLRAGEFRHGAKFMARIYGAPDDAIVTAAPDPASIRAIEAEVPGSTIELHAHEGIRIGDIILHDSYSHELAVIFVGANSQRALMRKYRQCVGLLGIEIDGQRWSPQ